MMIPAAARSGRARSNRAGKLVAGEMLLWMCALAIVIASAIWTKERGSLPALAQVHAAPAENAGPRADLFPVGATIGEESIARAIEAAHNPGPALASPGPALASNETEPAAADEAPQEAPQTDRADAIPTSTRWFDGKMVRPVRVIYMTVTGYSPDARSCGEFADGKTSIMYSVWTNGMNLVAADPKVLPYWSMISIPGYAQDDIVPVMDCGGAIKGNRLDLLYPTHKLARQWGVRQLPVTVWAFVGEDE